MTSARPGDLTHLAELTGESDEELHRWLQLGLLPANKDTPIAELVERAKLIAFAARRGVPPEEVARICHDQGVDMLRPFVRWGTRRHQLATFAKADAARRSGLAVEEVEAVWAATGIRDQTHADAEDLEALQMFSAALRFGLPLDVLLEIVRVYADAMGRASDAITRAFHLHVHDQFRVEGLSGNELMEATESIADPLIGLLEPAVLYFHRKSWVRASRDDLILHLLEESTTPGELARTILFVDLASYAPLTEAMGDAAAASVVARFADLVRANAAPCDGQIVKQIGDEFMLAFATPDAALRFGLNVHRDAARETMFPGLRIGAHHGPVVHRDGDYYGATVNLAARVTAAARRDQFLITEAVRRDAEDRPATMAIGARPLKGISGEVDLFAVDLPTRPDRRVDPVCGMGVDPESTMALTVEWQSLRLVFCSEACRRRFHESPGTYASFDADGR